MRPTTMGRPVVLPSEVTPLHLTLQQAFQTRLPTRPDFLNPSDSQDGISDSLCSSVYPGTLPWSLKDQFHYS